MAQFIMGPNVQIIEASVQGTHPFAIGTYTNGQAAGLTLDRGVILSSGNILDAHGPNNTDGISTPWGTPGDSGLAAAIGATTEDAAVLELQFVSQSSNISIPFQFGSDEYDEWVGSFNDGFGIFLNGNPLQLVGTDDFAGVGNVNLGVNSSLYMDNPVGSGNLNIQYDGLTQVITANLSVAPGTTNILRFVIADVNDDALDSSVFIGADTNSPIPPAPPCGPMVWSPSISSDTFSFQIAGSSNTDWNVYESSNLTSWTLLSGVTLDSSGNSSFSDSTITGIPYRFYKLSDSNCCSQAIGFTRVSVGTGSLTNGPGTNSLIANQLDSFYGNTLDGLFNVNGSGTMPDGTALPANSVIQKWDVPTQAYVQYTWDGSSWGGNGGVTLAPGEGAFLYNVGSGALTVTFVGLVREGTLNIPLSSHHYQIVSSMVPKAGGLQADLGYIPAFPSGPANPSDNDMVERWNGSSFSIDEYGQASNPHWNSGDPVINVGQAFFLKTTNTLWHASFSACQ